MPSGRVGAEKKYGAPRFPLENAIKLDEMTCAF